MSANLIPLKINLISRTVDRSKQQESNLALWFKRILIFDVLVVMVLIGLNVISIQLISERDKIDEKITSLAQSQAKQKLVIADVNYLKSAVPELNQVIKSQIDMLTVQQKISNLLVPGVEILGFSYKGVNNVSFQLRAKDYTLFRQLVNHIEHQQEFSKLVMSFSRNKKGEYSITFN